MRAENKREVIGKNVRCPNHGRFALLGILKKWRERKKTVIV